MIRVGVAGLRFGAQVHVPAFRGDRRCVVTALAGRDLERTQAAASALGIDRAHATWHALVDDAEVDAVAVALPPAEQSQLIVAAAAAGKHVFCEKPVAAGVAAAEVALAAVRAANVVHAMDFLFPEIAVWQRARSLLREGAIGTVQHFAYTWRVETYASRTNANSWKNRSAEGGGVTGNFVSHVIYNIEWLLGPLCAIRGLPRPAPLPWFCDAVVELASGVHGSIAVSTAAWLGGGHEVAVFGDGGTLVLRNATTDYVNGFALNVGTRTGGRLERLAGSDAGEPGDGRVAAVGSLAGRFLDAVGGGAPMTPSLADGVRVQRWLDRLVVDDGR